MIFLFLRLFILLIQIWLCFTHCGGNSIYLIYMKEKKSLKKSWFSFLFLELYVTKTIYIVILISVLLYFFLDLITNATMILIIISFTWIPQIIYNHKYKIRNSMPLLYLGSVWFNRLIFVVFIY